MYRAKMPVHILIAGVFCAGAAVLISALWIVVILLLAAPAHALQHWYDVPTGVLFLCRATCVPAGGFGFVCGVVGRLYLFLRSPHITSRGHLIAESAVIGALLSTCFPLFFQLMQWEPGEDWVHWISWTMVMFSIAAGCPVPILYAAFFHNSLLGSTSLPRAADDSDSTVKLL